MLIGAIGAYTAIRDPRVCKSSLGTCYAWILGTKVQNTQKIRTLMDEFSSFRKLTDSFTTTADLNRKSVLFLVWFPFSTPFQTREN